MVVREEVTFPCFGSEVFLPWASQHNADKGEKTLWPNFPHKPALLCFHNPWAQFCTVLYLYAKEEQNISFSFVFHTWVSDCMRRNVEGNWWFILQKNISWRNVTGRGGTAQNKTNANWQKSSGFQVPARPGLPTPLAEDAAKSVTACPSTRFSMWAVILQNSGTAARKEGRQHLQHPADPIGHTGYLWELFACGPQSPRLGVEEQDLLVLLCWSCLLGAGLRAQGRWQMGVTAAAHRLNSWEQGQGVCVRMAQCTLCSWDGAYHEAGCTEWVKAGGKMRDEEMESCDPVCSLRMYWSCSTSNPILTSLTACYTVFHW